MSISDRRIGCSRRYLLRALALTALFGLPRSAWPTVQIVGAVSEVSGEAVAERESQHRKLWVRSPVHLGDTLSTGTGARLKALLARKTALTLGAETKVRIDEFIVNLGGELALGSGALLLDTPSRGLPKGLSIQSPFALIAVRGTRFFAGRIEGIFGVFVVRGLVDVTAGGRTARLRAGEGTDIAKRGGPPGPVKKWGEPKIAKAMALVS
jgi:hypothetical protein